MEGWYAAADAYMKHFIRIKFLSTGRKEWNATERERERQLRGCWLEYGALLKASLLLFYFHGGG